MVIPGFEEQIEKFKSLARKVAKGQKRSDVHDLRVVTRRLRVIFWLMKQSKSVKIPAKTRSSLRKLGRSLGERRQLDVAIRDAAYYKLNAAKLEPLHRESSTALSSFLTSKKIDKLAKELRRIRQELICFSIFNFSKPMQTLLFKLNQWTAFPSNKAELHEFRIQIKKILYALEAVGQPVLPLTRIKDCLGRAHDLEALGKYFRNARRIRTDETQKIKGAEKLFKPAVFFAMKKLS